MTVLIEQCIADLREEGRYSEATVKVVISWLERCRTFFEPKSLLALRPKDWEDWHRVLAWTPGRSGKLYAENTVNQAIGVVRLFYRWALARELVREDPSKSLKMRGVPAKSRPNRAEERALLSLLSGDDLISVRDRALFGLILEIQIPLLACVRLDLKDLQTDTGALLVSGRNSGVHSLSQGLVDDLERYLQHARPQLAMLSDQVEAALFLNSQGRRISDQVIRYRLRIYRRKLA